MTKLSQMLHSLIGAHTVLRCAPSANRLGAAVSDDIMLAVQARTHGLTL